MRFTVKNLLLFILVAILSHQSSYAQGLLDKKVTLTLNKRPVKEVLNTISTQAGFYFSYITTTINNDSLISISVHNKTVKQTLDLIFGDKCQYKESDNHIIIQPSAKEKWYAISGYVTDRLTGIGISDVSVFERQTLASTLTAADGHFRLLIKESDRYPVAKVTVTMGSFYEDTTMLFTQGYDQQLNISLPPSNHSLQEVEINRYSGVERSWLGKHLFSTKLRKQSANLSKFFVDKPIQFSLTPGLGSHGKLSGQVVNTFSFNALGGYAAGVDGFELGGLFNIDKKDVKYVQVAGLFNVVSGNTDGVQIAGITNRVNDSMNGLQISGIHSRIKGSVKGMTVAGIKSYVDGNYKGFQLSGIANTIENDQQDSMAMEGFQLSGIRNKTYGNVEGVQMAGLINVAKGDVNGVQASAIFNRAKKVKGVQIGFVNIADTVDGYCIGFVNIVKKGYHTLCLSTNEVFNTNISFLGGNKKLYGIYTVSFNINPDRKAFGLGYGIGTQRRITPKTAFLAELTTAAMYTVDTTTPNIIKFRTGFIFEITKKISVHFGPSISLGVPFRGPYKPGYQTLSPDDKLYEVYKGTKVSSWIGWQAGINIF